ncbi:D-alanyl-lipoteichoic acid biosynthesis protein DltD [Sporolactobacillus kofuensis]|uniref:Protein DltD n=1 Tax=Sporolactobacillus kofuensis TaxID=269672 RepID=A0ABW1WDC4_9BACL|nr:D-alanyl-lipoteichoic acid biosynthesis protein DltD [Sporolactobacillus kofuensis]MCO7175439.1 D-alanyl-lipoteichoic acid biosynthesis protein DltD [Sporolactobacillus kofuensis]
MKFNRFGPMILAVVLVCAIIFMPTSIERRMVSSKDMANAAQSLDPHVFQGILAQQKMLENKQYLPMYGSSELLRLDRYHPANYFKVKPDGFTPFLIGRGGMYSLVHFLNLATTANELKGHKIVFILSPEWFTKTGLDPLHFKPNFSKEQAYHFALSNTISPALKEKVAKRLVQFKFIRDEGTLGRVLEDVAYPNRRSPMLKIADQFRAYGTYKILTLHDLIEMHRIKPGYKHAQYQKPDFRLASDNWRQLKQSAREMAIQKTRSNCFHIDQPLYDKFIRHHLNKFKNYRASESYGQSPEYADLQLVLDLLKEKHVDALFISVPFNGKWYDYAGVPKQRREIAYKKIADEIRSNGFKLADFTRFDSKPYFLQDTMHIGPMGWAYIDQSIKKFYDHN